MGYYCKSIAIKAVLERSTANSRKARFNLGFQMRATAIISDKKKNKKIFIQV
jgi:hypothetical protein